jgi:2-dehydro-3-deoxyphosphogluconate aldolase/(4S)-4-hydroxy-2-oxoglutarate aldolase
MTTLAHLLNHKIIAIIRGAKPDDVVKIATALYDGGVRALEITLNSPDALAVIKHVSHEMNGKLMIGAGTVIDAKSAHMAIAAGAKFIISPSLDIEIIEATKKYGAVSIPGAFTATEILLAYKSGADIVKIFPASVGPEYFNDLRGPFPHIPLMPTGGVNIDNIGAFKKAGAAAFGVGSALVNAAQEVTEKYLIGLKDHARKFSKAVSNS